MNFFIFFHKLKELREIIRNSKKYILSEPCILCNNKLYVPITSLTTHHDKLIILCINCGLARMNPLPTIKEYQDFYKKQFFVDYRTLQSRVEPSKSGYLIYEFVRDYINQIYGVFEIGCGDGRNLLAIRSINKELNIGGIEPSELTAETNSKFKKYNINITNGFSSNLSKELLNNYNLIIISHVFEHFINPLQELVELEKKLRINDIVYIEVPDNGYDIYKLGYWFRFPHIYYFTQYTISHMFEKVGFTVLKFEKSDLVLRYLITKNEKIIREFSMKNVNRGKHQLNVYKTATFLSTLYMVIRIIKKLINDIISQFLN